MKINIEKLILKNVSIDIEPGELEENTDILALLGKVVSEDELKKLLEENSEIEKATIPQHGNNEELNKKFKDKLTSPVTNPIRCCKSKGTGENPQSVFEPFSRSGLSNWSQI